MTQRAYNFSAGPAVLPESVLAEVGRDMLALPSAKASILELSHRGKTFKEIIAAAQAAEQNLTALAGHRWVGGIRASIYNAMPVAGGGGTSEFHDSISRYVRRLAPATPKP